MNKGILTGPYACQVLTPTRLKLWFATKSEPGTIKRYEALFDPRKPPVVRGRQPASGRFGSTNQAFFIEYAVPEDISGLPFTPYPRFRNDNMGAALMTLLTGDNLSCVTLLRMGIPMPTGL